MPENSMTNFVHFPHAANGLLTIHQLNMPFETILPFSNGKNVEKHINKVRMTTDFLPSRCHEIVFSSRSLGLIIDCVHSLQYHFQS